MIDEGFAAKWSQVLDASGLGPEDELTDEQRVHAASQFLGVKCLDRSESVRASDDFLREFPIRFARAHSILGMESVEGPMHVLATDTSSWDALETVSRVLRRVIVPLLATHEVVQRAINTAYEDRAPQTDMVLESIEGDTIIAELQNLTPREDLLDTSDRTPVIKLVNMMLFDAVKGRASDVHVQPYENRLLCRMRIDSVLFNAFEIPRHLQDEVVSRVKVLGGMNIAEKRLPQDGRATVEVGNRVIDLRIASMPTSYGERVVIRLLDKSARLYTLEELGLSPESLSRFRDLIHVEHGLILVTGPTGSGKSTTLYAALSELDTTQRNAVTLEDPIEYQLDGISQTQINTKKGMTFASGLRSILRQDPDIIMVGEIRDHETAAMAIQAALTGHLVFSTLHTNDAASAVTRLVDLGIEPYLLSSSLVGVLAQRLVRRNCPACSESHKLSDSELEEWSLKHADVLTRGTGCAECRGTGYRGRVGVFELLAATENIGNLILTGANASQISATAVAGGMRLMREDGAMKVASGTTTIDEVRRVTAKAS